MMHNVHPTAIIEPGASLAEGVTVGPYSIITSHARIGAGSRIGSHCVVGEADHGPLVIEAGANIRSHSVIYSGSTFGAELETGHRVTLREQLTVGRNFRVGTLCDLQGHAQIGDFVRLHSNVHIGQKSTIGNFVWIFPYTVLTNDPHPPSDGCTQGPAVGDCAVIGTMVTVLPAVRIGHDALVAAGSTVTRDVAPERVVMGTPAKDALSIRDVKCQEGLLTQPYPWWNHFRRGYPQTVEFTAEGPRYHAEEAASAGGSVS